MRIQAHYMLFAMALLVCAGPSVAIETQLQVRVLARDAKLIGDVVGGARVTIKEVATGRIIAEGVTKGDTGDTERIMRAPRVRGATVFDTPGAAGWLATLDLERPTLVEIAAEGPLGYTQALSRASKTMLLEPGADILGEGIVLVLHGYIVEILEPTESVDGSRIAVRVRVRLLCSCPTEPGGLWSVEQVSARLLRESDAVAETALTFSGETSVYTGMITADPGSYTLEVLASDPATTNFGQARRTVSFGR